MFCVDSARAEDAQPRPSLLLPTERAALRIAQHLGYSFSFQAALSNHRNYSATKGDRLFTNSPGVRFSLGGYNPSNTWPDRGTSKH